MNIFTVGHSNRTLEFLVSLLQGYEIERLVDVRTIPRSRYNSQFNRDTLPCMLQAVDIAYTHLPGLGGLRSTHKDSVNKGWSNSSFRGFADYMQTEEFETALEELIELARKQTVAFMCAEAVPWRCHRSLISDALTVRGVTVHHIMSRVSSHVHKITPFAKVNGRHISYPA